jgi:hypothetical protein
VTPLLEAWLKVFALLLSFVLGKNLVRILVALRLGIGVRYTNIDDTVGASGPKATYKYISTVIVDE